MRLFLYTCVIVSQMRRPSQTPPFKLSRSPSQFLLSAPSLYKTPAIQLRQFLSKLISLFCQSEFIVVRGKKHNKQRYFRTDDILTERSDSYDPYQTRPTAPSYSTACKPPNNVNLESSSTGSSFPADDSKPVLFVVI